MNRKITEMHRRFGTVEGERCNNCSNLYRGRYRTRRICKCELYGVTRSEATDWSGRYTACGMFCKPWESDRPVIELIERRKESVPVDGQISMEDDDGTG